MIPFHFLYDFLSLGLGKYLVILTFYTLACYGMVYEFVMKKFKKMVLM